MDSKAEVRFGDRLREYFGSYVPAIPADRGGVEVLSVPSKSIRELADAIDQDAGHLRRKTFGAEWQRDSELIRLAKEQAAAGLRGAVERLVEELRYSVTTYEGGLIPDRENKRDVLDVEPFLARLAGIFGVEGRSRDAARVDELLESYAPGYLAWLKEGLRARLLAALLEELPTESSMGDRIPPIVRQVFEEVK